MNDELQEAKISAMECDIKEIKQDIKEMPDLIVKKVNESISSDKSTYNNIGAGSFPVNKKLIQRFVNFSLI